MKPSSTSPPPIPAAAVNAEVTRLNATSTAAASSDTPDGSSEATSESTTTLR